MSQRSRIRPFFVLPHNTGLGDRETWQPAADIYRTKSGWLLKFELAGVTSDDVKVEVQGSRLSVRGVRRDLMLDECCSYYSLEIAYSHFERTVELPCDLGEARLDLEFRDGILLVRIGTEEGQP